MLSQIVLNWNHWSITAQKKDKRRRKRRSERSLSCLNTSQNFDGHSHFDGHCAFLQSPILVMDVPCVTVDG